MPVDAATAAPRVLDIAARTHPRIVLPSGRHQTSRRYQKAAGFQPLPPDPDPLERSAPAIELSDPSVAQIRHAVTSIGGGSHCLDGTRMVALMPLLECRFNRCP